MQLLNYLFVCFVNLSNSFILINTKKYPNFISYKCKHKLNIGGDYYIDENLHIYDHNNIPFSYIKLNHKIGYDTFITVFNKDEHWEKVVQYKKETLDTNIKSIVIFNNNTFNKLDFESKYKKLIEDKLNLFDKTWNDVGTIIKIEKIRE